MSIDWITVAAQILNFLVLVYLLKRFLYRPVIAAMDRREQLIADRFQQAQAREETARQAIASCEAQQRDFSEQRAQRLDALEEEIRQHRQRLRHDAHQEIAEERERWRRALEEELLETRQHMQREATQALADIARRALSDLATTSLEEAITGALIQRLEALSSTSASQTVSVSAHTAPSTASETVSVPASIAPLISALASGEAPARVLSSGPLGPTLRAKITETLDRIAQRPMTLSFTQDPDLLCGLAIECRGWRLDWSLDEYLTEIDERLQQALQRHALQQTPEKSEDTGEARVR